MIEDLFEKVDYKIKCDTCKEYNIFKVRGTIIKSINAEPFLINLDEDKTRICETCGSVFNER